MKVEVDTADITALEQRIEMLSAWLQVLVAKRKGGTVTIKQSDITAGSVIVEPGDNQVVLRFVKDTPE